MTGKRSSTFTNARSVRNGLVNVSQALTVSSDVFYYSLGERFWDGRGRYGQAVIQDVARSLGMGDDTDIDLPFEANGRVSDPAGREKLHKDNPVAFPYPEWYTGDNLNIAVGQGDTVVTPLQLANSYATFVNGGNVFGARVGDAVLDRQGQALRTVEARVLRRSELPAGSREALDAGFRGVVSYPKGTGYGAFAGFRVRRSPWQARAEPPRSAGSRTRRCSRRTPQRTIPGTSSSAGLEQAGLGASAAGPVSGECSKG